MKFPLSLDLRKATLNEQIKGQVIIDADLRRVMIVYFDEWGPPGEAGSIVDVLNAISRISSATIDDITRGTPRHG